MSDMSVNARKSRDQFDFRRFLRDLWPETNRWVWQYRLSPSERVLRAKVVRGVWTSIWEATLQDAVHRAENEGNSAGIAQLRSIYGDCDRYRDALCGDSSTANPSVSEIISSLSGGQTDKACLQAGQAANEYLGALSFRECVQALCLTERYLARSFEAADCELKVVFEPLLRQIRLGESFDVFDDKTKADLVTHVLSPDKPEDAESRATDFVFLTQSENEESRSSRIAREVSELAAVPAKIDAALKTFDENSRDRKPDTWRLERAAEWQNLVIPFLNAVPRDLIAKLEVPRKDSPFIGLNHAAVMIAWGAWRLDGWANIRAPEVSQETLARVARQCREALRERLLYGYPEFDTARPDAVLRQVVNLSQYIRCLRPGGARKLAESDMSRFDGVLQRAASLGDGPGVLNNAQAIHNLAKVFELRASIRVGFEKREECHEFLRRAVELYESAGRRYQDWFSCSAWHGAARCHRFLGDWESSKQVLRDLIKPPEEKIYHHVPQANIPRSRQSAFLSLARMLTNEMRGGSWQDAAGPALKNYIDAAHCFEPDADPVHNRLSDKRNLAVHRGIAWLALRWISTRPLTFDAGEIEKIYDLGVRQVGICADHAQSNATKRYLERLEGSLHYEFAERLRSVHSPDRPEKLYTKALVDKRPKNLAICYAKLGTIAIDKKDYEEARINFLKSIKVEKRRYVGAISMLARSYLRAGGPRNLRKACYWADVIFRRTKDSLNPDNVRLLADLAGAWLDLPGGNVGSDIENKKLELQARAGDALKQYFSSRHGQRAEDETRQLVERFVRLAGRSELVARALVDALDSNVQCRESECRDWAFLVPDALGEFDQLPPLIEKWAADTIRWANPHSVLPAILASLLFRAYGRSKWEYSQTLDLILKKIESLPSRSSESTGQVKVTNRAYPWIFEIVMGEHKLVADIVAHRYWSAVDDAIPKNLEQTGGRNLRMALRALAALVTDDAPGAALPAGFAYHDYFDLRTDFQTLPSPVHDKAEWLTDCHAYEPSHPVSRWMWEATKSRVRTMLDHESGPLGPAMNASFKWTAAANVRKPDAGRTWLDFEFVAELPKVHGVDTAVQEAREKLWAFHKNPRDQPPFALWWKYSENSLEVRAPMLLSQNGRTENPTPWTSFVFYVMDEHKKIVEGMKPNTNYFYESKDLFYSNIDGPPFDRQQSRELFQFMYDRLSIDHLLDIAPSAHTTARAAIHEFSFILNSPATDDNNLRAKAEELRGLILRAFTATDRETSFILDGLINEICPASKFEGTKVEIHGDRNIIAATKRNSLEIVITELLRNAAKAMPETGTIKILFSARPNMRSDGYSRSFDDAADHGLGDMEADDDNGDLDLAGEHGLDTIPENEDVAPSPLLPAGIVISITNTEGGEGRPGFAGSGLALCNDIMADLGGSLETTNLPDGRRQVSIILANRAGGT